MKLGMRTPQALATTEGESRDLVYAETPSTTKAETDAEIAPLIQKIGATSIAEIEELVARLQDTKQFLQSEGERIERETARYTNLAQTASASVKIIFDTVQEWRKAGHPVRNQSGTSAFEIVSPDQAEDDTGAICIQDEQPSQSSGQVRAS
jgi:hypothetical protein